MNIEKELSRMLIKFQNAPLLGDALEWFGMEHCA